MFQDQQPIAIVSLQMEEGTEEIRVYEGEDVELAVELFCQRYGLGNDCMHYLVDQINQQLKREPSPRFGDDLGHKLSFGQKGPLQPSESKQSDVGITTQASSVDENQPTIQKTYEQWQKKINQRTVWGIPKQPKQSNADRLYREAMDQQKIKQERTEYLKQQKTRIEEMQATFKPMISPRSRAMVNQKRQPGIDIGQQLYQKGIDMNLRKENKRIQHQEELKKLSPFRPNDTSRNQSKSPNRSTTPIYEKLFLQGKLDQQKKEQFIKNEFSKIYTFHPQINSKPDNIKSEVQDQQKYVEKLFKDQQDRQKKMKEKQREKSIQNQSTFQPSIIKDQTYQKVCKRQDYEDNMLANDLQKVKNKVESRNSFCSYTKPNQRHQSDASVLSQFDINVARIFNQLDEDKDGLISKEKLNLSAIDVSVLEIVSEALFKIEDENLIVNQNQFKKICQSVEGLAQELNQLFMKL